MASGEPRVVSIGDMKREIESLREELAKAKADNANLRFVLEGLNRQLSEMRQWVFELGKSDPIG